jgi:hypothetical protein
LALGLFAVLIRIPGLRWKAPAVLLLTVTPWLAAWQIHNQVVAGYSGFTSVAIEDLYSWEAAEVAASVTGRPTFQVGDEMNRAVDVYVATHPASPKDSQIERLNFMSVESSRILHQHFGTWMISRLKGTLRVIFSPGTNDLLDQVGFVTHDEMSGMRARIHDRNPVLAAMTFARTRLGLGAFVGVLELLLLAMYWFAAVGIVRRGAPRSCLWILCGISLYIVGISGGAVGGGRYRLPVMPIVCVLAAAGVQRRSARSFAADEHDLQQD